MHGQLSAFPSILCTEDGVISVAAALPNYAVFTTGSLEMNCYLVIAASPWNVPNLTEESQNSLVYGNFGARISKDLFYLAQVACTIASHSHCFWEKIAHSYRK